MAVITDVGDKKKIHVVRNIGFFKKIKDLVGTDDEQKGYEDFIEESIGIAKNAIPEGYEMDDLTVKPFAEVNIIVELTAVKRDS